jgi:hypothetical protein
MSKSEAIAKLNDDFRISGRGGRLVMTRGVAALPQQEITAATQKMRAHVEFTPDNDPYGEHDFGSFESAGQRFFWKIDYYDQDYKARSKDPTDALKTGRLLTLMLAVEY